MPFGTFVTTVGTSNLPDVGLLSYNGVVFNCLFSSKVSGQAVKDAANRTVKYVKYTITVDGVVTANAGEDDTELAMSLIRRELSKQGGVLRYVGRGLGSLSVNGGVGSFVDVAWGPIPEVLDMQPLGGSLSAMVRWTVTTCVAELAPGKNPLNPLQPNSPGAKGFGAVVQFNEEIGISYDEEGYSSRSIKGTLEIPLTRNNVNDRTLRVTVDDYREFFMDAVAASFDLTRFRVTRRNFQVSRDKRTMEWEFQADELPPMGLPPESTHARGTFSVRPQKQGFGLVTWICALRCTYVVRADQSRRNAWWAFLSLLKFRMEQGQNGSFPKTTDVDTTVSNSREIAAATGNFSSAVPIGIRLPAYLIWKAILSKRKITTTVKNRPALLMNFGFDEGLYLDSKTITFEASWRLITTLSHLLMATGVWRWQEGSAGGKEWASSVSDIMGHRSWLLNHVQADQDVIVDIGGP